MKSEKESPIVDVRENQDDTGAIPESFQAMEIVCGDCFPWHAIGVNKEGFFSDVDVRTISVEMLEACGIDRRVWIAISGAEFLAQSDILIGSRLIDFLKNRFQHSHTFAAKRFPLPRSLFSNQKVFDYLNLDPSYVLAFRNSIYVAHSLERLDWLGAALAERGGQIDTLNRVITERDNQIQLLRESLSELQRHQQQLRTIALQSSHRLKRVHASWGWRASRPIRTLKGLAAKLGCGYRIEPIPLHSLDHVDGEWQSTGDDPQFLLFPDRAWHGLAGWHMLILKTRSGSPLNAELYFDHGQGFDEIPPLSFQLSGTGVQAVPIYVSRHCKAIRFDPCDTPARFRLDALKLKRLASAPGLEPPYANQSKVYEALGASVEDACRLVPLGDVERHPESNYSWTSLGRDPHFLMEGIEESLRPGWFMVELSMVSNVGRGMAKLYLDFGSGFSENDSVALPFTTGQPSKRLCYMGKTPRKVRFDPLDSPGEFSIQRLRFVPVPALFAWHRMLKRLHNRCDIYRDSSLAAIWKDVKRRARDAGLKPKDLLFQDYGETFSVRAALDAATYMEWIARVEGRESLDVRPTEAGQSPFPYQPILSVVMPTYNTPERYLRLAIESVLKQSYPCWELCIADDASTAPHVRRILEEYAARDQRIKLVLRPTNGHISAASNSALDLAEGDYVALLDHDDELAEHAFYFVVGALQDQSRLPQIVYTDEDKIDAEGNRFEPHFKSDWNPDLFFSQNYVSHLGVYRRDLLNRVGGFRQGVEGSQDQDLMLRCLPHVNSDQILHVPKVLYHWRTVEGSTALAQGEKSYTTEAGVKALRDYFSSQGRDNVHVEVGLVPNTYRVRYPIPEPAPLVSLLIPTRDKLEFLEPCVRGILAKSTYTNFEILILDNQSESQETLNWFERVQQEEPRVRVLRYDHPFNFSAINNYGVTQAEGKIIGMINNDIEVISPEWLSEMVSHVCRQEIGCVGAKLYYDDDTIQHAGVILSIGGVGGHSHKYFPRASNGYFTRLKLIQNYSAVTAACLLVRKSVYEEVDGLDEENLKVAFNDVDFCLRVREAGYRNLWTPYAELYHHESKSRGAEDTREKAARFASEVSFMKLKWGEKLLNDPMYSPHLTKYREDFSIG